MIFLVTRQPALFKSNKYSTVSFSEAMKVLYPLKSVQLDTETEGLDCFTKKLLTIQLGNKQNQVVFDWISLTVEERKILKEYLESDRLFIGWNLLFDLRFLYVQDIWPNNVWDGMLAEKLLYLGYPAGMHEMSLKAAALRYLNYDLDKSVRGKIINVGLTEEVVVYAAGDVMHLEDIKEQQEIELDKKDLEKALQFENIFLKVLAYIEICGVKLDVPRWQKKMHKDLERMREAEQKLDDFVVDWCQKHPKESADTKGKHTEYVDAGPSACRIHSIKYITDSNRLLSRGFIRDPESDKDDYGMISHAYSLSGSSRFVAVDTQGNLFTGFDTAPKCNINWGSSKQVIPFFELLGFNLNTFDKSTKKKKKSVDAKIIKKQLDVSPISEIYLNYQEAKKVVSTYGENWIKAINPKTGRIHPDYWQLGADTARLSSGGGLAHVNIQNIPHDAETRACFISGKRNKWISADYQG